MKGVIFDVDGTILDTMPVWTDSGVRYLKSIGIEAEPGLGDILFKMTVHMGAEYLQEHYSLDQSIEEIARGIYALLEDFYRTEAQLKEGARELLENLHRRRIPMVVATSTDRQYILAALDRLGCTEMFNEILTCREVGASKSEPKIFLKAMEIMGTEPKTTWVFEDGLYAMKTAKKAGLQVVGVYDQVSEKDQDAIRNTADIYVDSLKNFDVEEIVNE